MLYAAISLLSFACPQEPAIVPVSEPVSEKDSSPGEAPEVSSAGPADWVRWERLGRSLLSPDGRWLAHEVRRGDGSAELRLRVLATDSTEVFEEGSGPEFSDDAAWLAYRRGISEEDREALEKKKKPAENGLGLFDLIRGERSEVDRVSSYGFDATGRYLAMRRYGQKGESNGADLVVRDMQTGLDAHFGRVGSYAWSDDGSLLAMTIDAPDQVGNGVSVYDASAGVRRVLDSGEADYAGLTWREDSSDLAVMRSVAWEDDEDTSQIVLAWRAADQAGAKTLRYDLLEDETQSGDQRVVTNAGLRWSTDGKVLYFGTKAWEDKPAELDAPEPEEEEEEAAKPDPDGSGDAAGDSEEPIKEDDSAKPKKAKSLSERSDEAPEVEVWHADDVDIVPLQKRTASRDENESVLCALWIDEGKLVSLDSDTLDVRPLDSTRWALGEDENPYLEEQRFSATQMDLYRVDVATGAADLLQERVKLRYAGDPTGRRILYVLDDHIWAHDLDANQAVNLTKDVDVAFTNREQSTLTTQKPPYGVASWTADGEAVFLYSRYDIWLFQVDGSGAKRLTTGADSAVRHRIAPVAADPDDEEYTDLARGTFVSLYGDRTKKSGYAWLDESGCEHRVFVDANVSGLRQAADAPVLVHSQQRFDDSPDLFVSGPSLADAAQASETNPFQSEYTWGSAELVDYENAAGEKLQGALYYPAGYEEGKTYPMVVYIYEERSQNLHRYVVPSERSPYNSAVFTSAGYFVFEPDIVYRAQNPGVSAVECVVPAVREVLSRGMVDPDRVGLMGHSWGAYQTAFIVTQTDLFAAGVAGAPLTNMMSMSMSIYWNSGQTDAWIFHESQGRMDRPFWDDVDTYIRNSPIFSVDDLETPLLMTFGDKDGAVDWHQGVEFYNAARLARSPLVMLVYPGENHGLRRKPNQLDYHARVFDWFEHHLKGEEADDWISKGVSWLDQKKALEAKGSDD